jgi:hypothetical protein
MLTLAKTPNALAAIRQNLVRCGFELEFHQVDGMNMEDIQIEENEDGGTGHDFSMYGIDGQHIEVSDDQSVRGGEIRTIGALSPCMFMAAIKALFDTHEFKIDTGCSFHIHLSVPGIKHRYGKAIQAELTAFLLNNQDRLPDSVKKRLKSDNIRFCRFKIAAEKFSAVHGHPQGTWEFRLFGNINNTHDAWKCLLLAIDALRHAYRVRFGMVESLVSAEIALKFEDLASHAIANGVNLRKAERYLKIFGSHNLAA